MRLIDAWNAANQELAYRTTALTSIAMMGNAMLYGECAQQVDAARLKVDNARSALQLHRSTHSPIEPSLFAHAEHEPANSESD